MKGGGCPVIVRGVLYHSQRAAAKALGVSDAALRRALDAGRVDDIGLSVNKGGRPGKPCFYRGKRYPSMSAAALACGVSRAAVCKAMQAWQELARAA